MRRVVLATILSLAAAGCATSQKASTAREQFAESRASLRAAEEVGADRIPESARYLGYARQQLDEADRLLAANEYDAADLVLRQAAADADLALALAREVPLRTEAQQLRARAEALRREQP
ncbi:DUF4398 domain-containing protein [Myxococcaceae bacterium GXIMD 01537]